MNRQIIWFYLVIVFVILGIMLVGIYVDDDPTRTNADSGEVGFKPMSVRVKEATAAMKQKEAVLASYQLEPEYDAMVHIPAGRYVIGSRDGQWVEQPEREIFLSGYRIDKYEVNFAQFYAFIAATGNRKPRLAGYLAVGSENLPAFMEPHHPVVGVSWLDAHEYCAWRGKRLPTEAEWERAARGGDGRKWPWGDEPEAARANLVGAEDGSEYTAAVGSFARDESPAGVHDLAGNAMEWVADWFQEDYYRGMPERDPVGPPTGDQKSIRGASWNDSLERARTTVRFKIYPEYRDVTIGFRCAKSDDSGAALDRGDEKS